MIEMGRGREGGQRQLFPNCHLAKGPLGPGPGLGTEKGARGQEQREAPEPGLGQGEPWWQLQDVDIVPYLGLLALTPRPQPPLEPGGPCRSLPKQTVTGFPLSGEGARSCLLN